MIRDARFNSRRIKRHVPVGKRCGTVTVPVVAETPADVPVAAPMAPVAVETPPTPTPTRRRRNADGSEGGEE